MITHRPPAPPDFEIDYVFLTCSFEHKGIGYRAAVVQHSDMRDEFAGEAGYHHHVLLQSAETFYSFVMYKGEEEIWESYDPLVPQEIVFLLSNEITEG